MSVGLIGLPFIEYSGTPCMGGETVTDCKTLVRMQRHKPFLTPPMKRVYVKLKLDHVTLTENLFDKFGVIRKGYAVEQLIAGEISFTYSIAGLVCMYMPDNILIVSIIFSQSFC